MTMRQRVRDSRRRHEPAVRLATLLLGAVLAACGPNEPPLLGEPTATLPASTATATTPVQTPLPAATPTPAPRWPVTLAAVGDVMLARSLSGWISEEAPDGPFQHVRDLLGATDLTVANLECAISDRGRAEPKSYTFRAPPLAARGLAIAGFDVLALANNHSLDYGIDAMLDTVESLQEAGVSPVGAGRNDAEAYAHVVVEREGVRVAFLSVAEVPNEAGYDMTLWTATAESPGIAWVDEARIAAGVARAREDADIVVVFFHFGNEGWSSPSNRQRQLARAAIDAGANLVLGTHPHVLQEVEEYGAGVIAYSLGNFVFDGFDGAPNRSAILFVTFSADGTIAWRMEPVRIGWDGLPRPSD